MINHATTANPCSLALRLAATIATCNADRQDDMDLTLLHIHRIARLHLAADDPATRDLAEQIVFKFNNGDEPETLADYNNWLDALAIMLPPVVIVRA